MNNRKRYGSTSIARAGAVSSPGSSWRGIRESCRPMGMQDMRRYPAKSMLCAGCMPGGSSSKPSQPTCPRKRLPRPPVAKPSRNWAKSLPKTRNWRNWIRKNGKKNVCGLKKASWRLTLRGWKRKWMSSRA